MQDEDVLPGVLWGRLQAGEELYVWAVPPAEAPGTVGDEAVWSWGSAAGGIFLVEQMKQSGRWREGQFL